MPAPSYRANCLPLRGEFTKLLQANHDAEESALAVDDRDRPDPAKLEAVRERLRRWAEAAKVPKRKPRRGEVRMEIRPWLKELADKARKTHRP
jgi:hypothetical protein